MKKWAYKVDDIHGDSRITNVALKDLKPMLHAAKKRANKNTIFYDVKMSKPIATLLIENALINTYSYKNVATITIRTSEG